MSWHPWSANQDPQGSMLWLGSQERSGAPYAVSMEVTGRLASITQYEYVHLISYWLTVMAPSARICGLRSAVCSLQLAMYEYVGASGAASSPPGPLRGTQRLGWRVGVGVGVGVGVEGEGKGGEEVEMKS